MSAVPRRIIASNKDERRQCRHVEFLFHFSSSSLSQNKTVKTKSIASTTPAKNERHNKIDAHLFATVIMVHAADAFRALATARVSCKRFDPDRIVPERVIHDILKTSLVSNDAFFVERD
jgi:hypothetical protein